MNIWTIMTNELRRLLRSRTWLLNMILLPIVLIFLLGASLSGVIGAGSPETVNPVKVAIVNAAGQAPAHSAMLEAFVKSDEVKSFIIPVEVQDRGEAESGLRTGKYGYAVIVPQEFDRDIQSGVHAGWNSFSVKTTATILQQVLCSTTFSAKSTTSRRQH